MYCKSELTKSYFGPFQALNIMHSNVNGDDCGGWYFRCLCRWKVNWLWREQEPLKRGYSSTRQHTVTSQKTAILQNVKYIIIRSQSHFYLI